MGNVQSEPSAGGGSRKEQASDRAPDSRRTSLVEPEMTSQAMRLTRGLGVWFPGSSAPPGLLVPREPQASPSTLPLTLERPSPVMSPPEEAAAVSAPPPAPAGTLLPGPSKWQKPAGTPVPRIRGLLEASHRGQGDPPSLRPLPTPPPPPPPPPPTPPRQLSVKDTVPRAPSQFPSPLEPWKPPPPLPSERQPADRRITPALATPASTLTESQAGPGNQGQTAGRARGGAPPQAGEGEMAQPVASESGLSLLCKITFKSGPSLAPPAASSSLAAKASLGGGGGGGLFAASGPISYAEVLKQGPLPPGSARPLGEVPRGAQEAEGGDGDGEGCSGPPSAPASQAQALPPPPYTTFPGSKPKFDWVSAPDGPERHFRFNGAGGGIGASRRRAAALSGPAAAPIKTRTRRNKGSRAARGATREDGLPGDGPREGATATVLDSSDGGGGGSGASQTGAANTRAARHWPPFQVLNSCPCKCYCRHQPRHRRLPRNVSAWLSTPTNHLGEPPWVATIKLAGSLVAGLEHYDLQATHSN
ncbi:PREDICTED: gametogenetin [Mandrillus leucophaeus]|uniref:gametogenetin n=1 Tax=Mandrillus leucophaeus TaxID=9568 RepID=UPI0005F53433|nr:PREDICTED: gametogenetin [Mandrillus leucophaeus]